MNRSPRGLLLELEALDVRAFIGAGFDINTIGYQGKSIAHAAVWGGGPEMVMYLIQLGGKKFINSKDDCECTPLHLAMYGDNRSGLRLTELLLQLSADIHARDGRHDTPTHDAAREGYFDSMQRFIAAGFDFHTRGLGGKTIPHRARHYGTEMMDYILQHEEGRRIIHVRDDHGKTLLVIRTRYVAFLASL